MLDITFVESESANSDVVGTMRFGFTTYKGTMEGVAGWATAWANLFKWRRGLRLQMTQQELQEELTIMRFKRVYTRFLTLLRN